jgi:general secretion pathway protein G
MQTMVNRLHKKEIETVGAHHQAGFTLIEIMVVVVIIGILAGIVGVNIVGRVGEARRESSRVQIQNFSNALEMYKMDNGFYPTSAQGLEALITPPTAGQVPKKFPMGGYMKKDSLPKDPYGSDYVYISPGVHGPFDIVSYGADGQPGGEDENADIASWE